MNRISSYARSLLVIASASIFLTSCLKDKDNNYQDTPAAGLMSFNLAPDQQSIVFRLSNNTLSQQPLTYTSYSGVYQPIYVGNRSIEAFDYPAESPLTSSNFNFEQDKYYSLFLVGYNNSYKNVVVRDNIDSLNGPSAYIRYVNGIADSVNAAAVTISAAGANVVNDNAPYASVSELKAVNAGDISVVVKSANGVDVNRSFPVEQSKVYTVLLTGVPGATEDAKKVQIRYIVNGTLTTGANQ